MVTFDNGDLRFESLQLFLPVPTFIRATDALLRSQNYNLFMEDCS